MKYRISLLSFGLLAASLTGTPNVLANQPVIHVSTQAAVVNSASDAELDSLLAPVALYPDTLLTHILIASTYPLDIVAADRWRQTNNHLSPAQVELALRHENWDPSVKALIPFSDILALMANDLAWLSAVGNAVLSDQSRVLDRVQHLRRYAHRQGTLRSNSYLQITHGTQFIAIGPRHHTQINVPYYDTRHVFGHWQHRIEPVYWRYPVHARPYAGFHWSVGINLSTGFYFGSIHWQDRYVAISHEPVRRWRPTNKRVHSRAFQRWQHRQRVHAKPVKRVISHQRQLTVGGDLSHRVGKQDTLAIIKPEKSHSTARFSKQPTQRAGSVVNSQQKGRSVGPLRQLQKPVKNAVGHSTQTKPQNVRPVRAIRAGKTVQHRNVSKQHQAARSKSAKPHHHR